MLSAREMALNLALSALGWSDWKAPRVGDSAKERMDALLEQFQIALDFLDTLSGHPL